MLFILNESLQVDSVDIHVYIDGRRAVARRFARTTAKPEKFEFEIEEGKHTLRAISTYVPNDIAREFIRSSRPYGVIVFEDDPAPARFVMFFSRDHPDF